MDKSEIILKTKQRLDEINDKIKEVQLKVDETTEEEIKKQSQKLLDQLNNIQSNIKEQYSNLAKPENQDKTKVSEIEKNIFNSIESFDSAFSKAGSIFKTK